MSTVAGETNADDGIVEFESSLRLPLHRTLFDAIQRKHGFVRKENVVHYSNGIRISNYRVQQKIVNVQCSVLKIFLSSVSSAENKASGVNLPSHKNALFLPMIRKKATEFPSHLPQNLCDISLFIVRFILHESREKNNCTVRIAVEKHLSQSDGGGNYAFTAEVEYSESTSKIYKRLYLTEAFLLNKIFEQYGPEIRQVDFELVYSSVDASDMLGVPSRKFSHFTEERAYACTSDPNCEIIMHKFDGYKARFINNGSHILFYDDLHNMITLNSSFFDFAPKIIFQCEIMKRISEDCVPSMILTDVIGAYVQNTLFMSEPYEALKLFQRIDVKTKPIHLVVGHLGIYRLKTQYRIQNLHAKCDEATDGYLLINGNRLFKYKIPTVDVRYVDGFLHLDGTKKEICNKSFTECNLDGKPASYINGAIYEIAPNGVDNFTILRRRFDRIYTSSISQFEQFLQDTAYFRNVISKKIETSTMVEECK